MESALLALEAKLAGIMVSESVSKKFVVQKLRRKPTTIRVMY